MSRQAQRPHGQCAQYEAGDVFGSACSVCADTPLLIHPRRACLYVRLHNSPSTVVNSLTLPQFWSSRDRQQHEITGSVKEHGEPLQHVLLAGSTRLQHGLDDIQAAVAGDRIDADNLARETVALEAMLNSEDAEATVELTAEDLSTEGMI